MFPILALLLQSATPAPAVAPWTATARPSTDPTITSTVAGVSSADNNARLVLRCDVSPKGKFVSLQFFSRTVLGGPPNRPVSLTMDGGTPLIDNWEFVDKAAYTRSDAGVTTLAQAIAAAKSIALHTTTTAGEPVDATFAGPGSDAPVKALLAKCDYQLGVVPVRAPEKKDK